MMNVGPNTVARSPSDANTLGQAYTRPGADVSEISRPVERPGDDAGVRDDKKRFIQQNQEKIQECNQIVKNKYAIQQLSMQTLQQDKEFQNCITELTPEAEIASLSVSSGSERVGGVTRQTIDVNICVDTGTAVGTICSEDVEQALEIIGAK